MHRGELWWASLPDPLESGPGHRRPTLIIQADAYNRSRIRTVIVVSLTTNLKLAQAPGNVLLRRAETGLPKDSVANVSQILTVDTGFLTECLGALPTRLMQQVDAGLRQVLELW